jgi:hypothetical protein
MSGPVPVSSSKRFEFFRHFSADDGQRNESRRDESVKRRMKYVSKHRDFIVEDGCVCRLSETVDEGTLLLRVGLDDFLR